MSVDLPPFPNVPRLFHTPNFSYSPAKNGGYSSSYAPSDASSVASSTRSSRANSRAASRSESPMPDPSFSTLPIQSSSSLAAPHHTGHPSIVSPSRYRSASGTSTRSGSAYPSRRSSMSRFPIMIDGADQAGTATPPSRRMSRTFFPVAHTASPAGSRSRSRTHTATSTQSGFSQSGLPSALSANLQTLWPTLHSFIIPHLTPRDLMELRIASKSFSPTVSPRLFEHLHITFSRAVLRPSRIFTLKHVGHHVRTLTFRVPHSAEMVLPPLIDDNTGEVRSFDYKPEVSNPALGIALPNSADNSARYGSNEMAELLIQKYPPLFHVATNVSGFMDLFSAFPELVHLIISCPGQRAAERLKMSIVDYSLISIRIGIEHARLSKLTRLSINRIHASGLRHLHPVHGAGSSAIAVSRWSQIRTLDMIVDVLPLYHSPPLVRGIKADVDSVLMVRQFMAYFAPVVERLGFAWAGGRGPNVLSLGKGGVSVAESGMIATSVIPAMSALSNIPASSKGTGIFGRKRFPVISRPEPTAQAQAQALAMAMAVNSAPITTSAVAADVLLLPQLTELRVARIVDTDRNLAAMLQSHSSTLTAFSLEDVGLTSGSWIEVLGPLTLISGSTEWRTQVVAALSGMDAACGARVKIVGGEGGLPKHVLVTLLAEAAPAALPATSFSSLGPNSCPPPVPSPSYPGYQQVLAAHAQASGWSVASSAASAVSGISSSTSVSSNRSSVVTSSATSCYSVCPPASSMPALPTYSPPSAINSSSQRKIRPASFVSAPAVRLTRPARSTTISTPSPTVYGPFSAKTPMLTITEAKTPTSPGLISNLLRGDKMPSMPDISTPPNKSVQSKIPLAGHEWSPRSRSGSSASVVSNSSGAITINVRSKPGNEVDAARSVINELACSLPPVEGSHPMHRLCDYSFADGLIKKPTARQIEAAVQAAGEWRHSMVAEYGVTTAATNTAHASDAESEADDDDDDMTPVPNKWRERSMSIAEPTSPSPAPPSFQSRNRSVSVGKPATATPLFKQPFVKRSLRHISSLVRMRKEEGIATVAQSAPKELRLRQLALVSDTAPPSHSHSHSHSHSNSIFNNYVPPRGASSQPTSRPTSPPMTSSRPMRYSMAGPIPSRRPSIQSSVASIQEEDESTFSPVVDYRPEEDAEVARYLREVANRSDSDSGSGSGSDSDIVGDDAHSRRMSSRSRFPIQPPCSPAASKAVPFRPEMAPPMPALPNRAFYRSANSIGTSAVRHSSTHSISSRGPLHVVTQSTPAATTLSSSFIHPSTIIASLVPSPGPDLDWMCNFAPSPTQSTSMTNNEVESSSSEFDADDTDLTITEANAHSNSMIYRGSVQAQTASPLSVVSHSHTSSMIRASPQQANLSRVATPQTNLSRVATPQTNLSRVATPQANLSRVSTPVLSQFSAEKMTTAPIRPPPPPPASFSVAEPYVSSRVALSSVALATLNGTNSLPRQSRVHRALSRAKSAFGLNAGLPEPRSRATSRME